MLKSLGVPVSLATSLGRRLQGQPISNATRLVTAARKRALLGKMNFETALEITVAEQLKAQSHVENRRNVVASLHEAGKSAHQIAKELGISHTTVLRDLKAISED